MFAALRRIVGDGVVEVLLDGWVPERGSAKMVMRSMARIPRMRQEGEYRGCPSGGQRSSQTRASLSGSASAGPERVFGEWFDLT